MKLRAITLVLFLLITLSFFQCKEADLDAFNNSEVSFSELAFDNAVGFGTSTVAGKYGQVIRVTNLNPNGPGSLVDAINQEGARIIVFEVGGVIDLQKQQIIITEPYLTIAGQTAPSPGITIIKGSLSIETHDVLIKHISVRPGDAHELRGSGWEPDGISVRGEKAYNVVVDHCSLTWAVDENLSVTGPRTMGYENTAKKVTFSSCIIAEGLNNSTHSKGAHSMGSLIHDFCTDIAIIRNLYAHNERRNPYFKANTTGVIVNNYIYNPGKEGIYMNYLEEEFEGSGISPENGKIAIVGNVMKLGHSSDSWMPFLKKKGDVYLEDNIATNKIDQPIHLLKGSISLLNFKPVWPEGLIPLPSSEVQNNVLLSVGSRPRDRDKIDERIINEVVEGKGRIIDSQEDVGGYPVYDTSFHELKVPKSSVEIDIWLNKLASELEQE